MEFLIYLATYSVLSFALLQIPGAWKWRAEILSVTGVLAIFYGRYFPDPLSFKGGVELDWNFYGFFISIYLVWLLTYFLNRDRKYLFCLILAIILCAMGFARVTRNDFFWGQAYISLRLIWLIWDIRNERVAKAPGFFDFTAFVFYFPSLCVGPFFSYFDFEKQLRSPLRPVLPTGEQLFRMFRGLLKFIILAPSIHTIAITVIIFCGFKMTVWDYLLGLPATYIYLYLTFSGSSDIVLPISETLGFRLPENFDSPFKSKNVAEFWTRWNVSLGYFFRYVIYFPLLKEMMTKHPGLKHYFTPALLMLIMCLMGLWHGFQLGFILYGVVHGVALVVHYFYSLLKPKIQRRYAGVFQSRGYQIFSWVATHGFISMTLPLVLAPNGWLTF